MKRLRKILNIQKIADKDHTKFNYYWHGIKIYSRNTVGYFALTRNIYNNLSNLQKKVSMIDNTWRINDTLFYVPLYPYDFIQNIIVNTNNYFESDILKELENYIPCHATILDIGANIGNHSLYWAKELNAKKIIAFEPVKETYAILRKNIEINDLTTIIESHNIGLSNSESNAKIQAFTMQNIGATVIEKSESGNIQLKRLDDFDFTHIEKIDFIKIDVEGHEIFALEGAKETLKKYKPILFIETFAQNKDKVFSLLNEIGYKLEKEFPDWNFLFFPAK